jgi:acetyltransferase-like isoleucine patch superfamily enzyme
MITPAAVLKRFALGLANLLRAIRLAYIRANGVKVGRNTMISLGAKIDTHRSKVSIGDDSYITSGCIILAHDGSARQIDPADDGYGTVTIGNRVVVGVNSVVLRNVTIGDNSVIGAGSVVTRDIPSNCVAAGNPARVIRSVKPHLGAVIPR